MPISETIAPNEGYLAFAMRATILTISVALVLAACGGSAAAPANSGQGGTSSTSGVTSTQSQGTETPSTTESAPPADGSSSDAASTTTQQPTETQSPPATEPPIDGPAAPLFELALHSGETFSLADELKPVYLVFWAEW